MGNRLSRNFSGIALFILRGASDFMRRTNPFEPLEPVEPIHPIHPIHPIS